MSYDVRLTLPDKAEQRYSGVDGVFLVNPETHGEPFLLAEMMDKDAQLDTDSEILLINTEAVVAIRVKKVRR